MQTPSQYPVPMSQRGDKSLYSLQSDLLEVWTKLQVQDFYQNLILAYLDTLPLSEAQEKISKEIKQTYQGRSFYFKLADRLKSRKQSLSSLQMLIESNTARPDVDPKSLANICEQISSLRDNNLGFAEALLNLQKKLELKNVGISDQCMQMLKSLDQDNQFLKQSFLKDFILFQQGYDPFFLHHYDMKGKQQPKKSSPLIDQLFSLSLSYACRLFKAKNQVLDVLSHNKTIKPNIDQNYNTKMSQPFLRRGKLKIKNKESIFQEEPQERKSLVNFRRKGRSLKHAKEKYQTIDLKSSRKFTSLHKEDKGSLPPLELSRAKRDERYGNQQQYRNFKYKTQAEEESDNQYSLNKYRIKPVKLLKRWPQQEKKTIFKEEQDEEEIASQKMLSIRPKKSFHPLNKYKNLKTLKHQNREFADKAKDSQGSSSSECKSSVLSRVDVSLPLSSNKSAQGENINTEVQKSNASATIGSRRLLGDSKSVLKMRPGKFSLSQLVSYLHEFQFTEQIISEIKDPSWQDDLKKCQSYVNQYMVDKQVVIVSISILQSDGNYRLKLWGPSKSCPKDLVSSLLAKHLTYLQKNTSLSEVHYRGNKFLGLQQNGFHLDGQKLYKRKREVKIPKKTKEIQPFLSIKCSNIVIPQSNPEINLLVSQQIEPFSDQNSFSFLPFTIINQKVINQNLKMLIKVTENIQDMKTLNTLLEDQDLDTYECTNTLKVTEIKALRLNLANNFNVPFIAVEGYFKFQGPLIYNIGDSYICQLLCSKFNTKVFFGKGFDSIDYFMQYRKGRKGRVYEYCDFSVKMFSKQIYGHIDSQQKHEGCYGNWQVSLSWEDEIQGRTKHEMTNCIHFGPQEFYVGIQIQSELLYCFQVFQQDFLL